MLAVTTRRTSQTIFRVHCIAGLASLLPMIHSQRSIVRVQNLLPSESERLLDWLACEFAPAVIHEVDALPRNRRPHNLREGIGQQTESNFAFAQCLGSGLVPGDYKGEDDCNDGQPHQQKKW